MFTVMTSATTQNSKDPDLLRKYQHLLPKLALISEYCTQNNILAWAAAESAFLYYSVKHDFSLRSSDPC